VGFGCEGDCSTGGERVNELALTRPVSVGPKRPILRYHGGKWMLAKWIISHMPPHRIYVEPFGGAASVLLRKPRSYAEGYNDKWDTVVNVFRVMRDPDQARELRRLVELTPFARTEFLATGEVELSSGLSDLEKARRTIFRSFAGFGSAATNAKYATGFRSCSNRSGTTPAHDWQHMPQTMEALTERLRGVVIENRDALLVMQQHDTPQTLHYVDPPYVHVTRNMKRGNAAYECELTDADHVSLATGLHALTGMVMISGYACPLYGELYGDWNCEVRDSHADGARKRREIIWFNDAAWNAKKGLYA
jgi:DNA adenine methylase